MNNSNNKNINEKILNNKNNEDIINKKINKKNNFKKLQKKFLDLKEKYLIKKDIYNINYNKINNRLKKELENFHKFSLKKKIIELFPIIDSIEQALFFNNKDIINKIFIEKMKYSLNLFKCFLKYFNVNIINKINIPFDPNIHEAISMQFSKKHKSNTILHIMQSGYILHKQLLRPAMVIVSNK